MALDAKKYERLKALLTSDEDIADDVRSQALAAVSDYENEFLDKGWGGSQNRPASGVSVRQPAAPTQDEIAGSLLQRLDPSMPIQPQVLAIQPSTTHPKGDEAAAAEWSTGQLDNPNGVVVVYEAPVASVRQKLMENPQLFGALGFEAPMTPEAVQSIELGDTVHKAYNDYEWRRVAEEATKAGKTAYRYSRAPYIQGGEHGGVLDTLSTKVKHSVLPALDLGTAFVMGVDNAANFSAASRAAEAGLLDEDDEKPPTPGQVSGAVKLGGKDEAVGTIGQNAGSTAEGLDMVREEHPTAEGLGQVAGTFPGLIGKGAKAAVGAVSRAGGEAVERTLAALPQWNTADMLWDWVTKGGKGHLGDAANPLLKVGSDVLHAAGGAAADQLVREGVQAGTELAGTGQTSVTAQGAFDRGLEAAKHGAAFAAVPAIASRGGAAGRQIVEDRFPHIEAAAPHLQWGASSVITGPRLKPETRALVRDARKRNVSPVGSMAEEVAPALEQKAAEGTQLAKGRAYAERSNYRASPEGAAPQSLTHLERMSLEKLRDHHQPQADGSVKAVSPGFKEAQQVFNRHVAGASLEPTKGALELDPGEADAFLGARARYQLVKNDIDAAAADRASKPIDRKAYLQTQPAAKRQEIDDDIQASIDDLMPVDKGGAPKTVDERSAEYKAAEQQVLRERVDTETVLEPFGGSLAEYLKQRGKDRVYVATGRGVDARRLDTIVGELKDPDLVEAAKYDRQQFTKDGERGGYELMRRRHDKDIAKAEATEKSVAPGGDAFQSVVRHGTPRAGDEKDVAAMQQVADAAGPNVRKKVDEIRSLNSALDVTGRSWFAGKDGGKQGFFSLGNQADAMSLRAYPALRALDTMGGLSGGGMGRLETLGKGDEPNEKRRRERDEKRVPAYKEATKDAPRDAAGRAKDRSDARKKKLERVRKARAARRARGAAQ